MKKRCFSIMVGVGLLLGVNVMAAEANLLKATNWVEGGAWIHMADSKQASTLRGQALPLLKQTKVNGVLTTDKPAAIEKAIGKNAAIFSASWWNKASLPATVKNLTFSFNAKYSAPGKFAYNNYVLMNFKLKDGKTKWDIRGFSAPQGAFKTLKFDYVKPQDAIAVEILIRLDGCGKIEYKDLVMTGR